jgi:predicted methyltransferase
MIKLTALAREILRAHLRPGDWAVDLTAGNGHDTLTLAEVVGVEGRVWAFDLQAEAIDSTRRRLESAGVVDRVRLIRADHAGWAAHASEAVGRLAAVVANLGYLPGGDHARTTRADSTVAALESAWPGLRSGGLLLVLVYRGHPAGAEEDAAVAAWVERVEGGQTAWTDPAPPLGPRMVVVHKS